MAIDFSSPSYRAASSDLTIAISPLGLVELADEEFEVHGPRLNRYANHWAWYLGHHWSYRREVGEPLLTFNYVRAFQDYITNFTFGRGVSYRVPKETEAIIPQLLDRVWHVDNHEQTLLWEIGCTGGVSGDVFIKVAYEEPYTDAVGMDHPGKVRVLPLNPSFCFPEWHPHDRSRLIRFKLKYRFWGTSLEGTRQVFTYTELMTDEAIEEYINDEMIDSRPNPLGLIPVIPVQNIPVPSSPWGMSDIQDIVGLNREYNEKATDISDIINYHSAPVTVITGAKASQLEKGPKKVWGGLPKDAQVFNLELGASLDGPLKYLEIIKRAMHEMTGVPEMALGQMQPISNTSGVALAIQYQPLMNRYALKRQQYGRAFERVNELILRYLALYEPDTLMYDPSISPPLKAGQFEMLNPSDPTMYQTVANWPDPLPIDKLVKLNEIQGKMALGLESKRGALRDLGEESPDEKLQELFDELVQDKKEQGALSLIESEIASTIAMLTGMVPDIGGEPVEPPSPSEAGTPPTAGQPPAAGIFPGLGTALNMADANEIANELTTLAQGTKLPQRRSPEPDTD